MSPGHRSSAMPLAAMMAALIAYASLYPFTGWRVPGVTPWSFLALPWPPYWTGFDLTANLLGYMPLGALLFGGLVRSGHRPLRAFAWTVAAGAALSLTLEVLQNYLPHRIPSNLDLGLNTAGALLGAAFGWGVHRLGMVERWQAVRERWFIAHSAGGLALLLLWPVGLLFPMPAPLGMGQVLPRLREAVVAAVDGTPAEDWVQVWTRPAVNALLSPGAEFMLITLGLLAPCLVAYAVSPAAWRRMVMAAGAALLGFAATTLSTALNFGPQHALAWLTPVTPAAFVAGFVLALLLMRLPRRAAAGVGLVVLGALVALVADAPADPYFADSLQGWEQGRFIRFHGAAQWIGWLWPYVAMLYLLARIGARERSADAGPRGEAPQPGS